MAPLSRGHPVILPLYTRALTGREIKGTRNVSWDATPHHTSGRTRYTIKRWLPAVVATSRGSYHPYGVVDIIRLI